MADGPWTKYAAPAATEVAPPGPPTSGPSGVGPATGPWTKYAHTPAPATPTSLPASSISAREPSAWDTLTAPIREGAIGKALHLNTETVYNPEAQAHQEQLLATGAGVRGTGTMKGAAEFAGGLTTPGNLMVMAGTSGLGALEPVIGKAGTAAAAKLLSAGFTYQMVEGAVKQSPDFVAALKRGDYPMARQIGTQMGLSGAMAYLSGSHAVSAEPTPLQADLQGYRDAQPPAPYSPGPVETKLRAFQGKLQGTEGRTPKPSPEPTPGPSAAPTAVLSGQQVPGPQGNAKTAPTAPKAPAVGVAPGWVQEAQVGLAEADKGIAEAQARVRNLEKGMVPIPGQGDRAWDQPIQEDAEAIRTATLALKGRAQAVAAEKALTDKTELEGLSIAASHSLMFGEKAVGAQETPKPQLPKPGTPEAAELLKPIATRLEALSHVAAEPGVADERAKLLKMQKDLTPQAPKTSTPLDDIASAAKRVVIPDANSASRGISEADRQSGREAELAKLVDQHTKSGAVTPDQIRESAQDLQTQAAQIQYHIGLESYRQQLDAIRGAAQPEKTRAVGFDPEGRQFSRGSVYLDSSSPQERTILRMLGGANLEYTRLRDETTGRVARKFENAPTEAESKFAYEQQGALGDKVQEFIDQRRIPNREEMADLVQHLQVIEDTTGMHAVYNSKGGIDQVEPSRSALNKLMGRPETSHLKLPDMTQEGRAGTLAGRYADAAAVLARHANRVEGIESVPPQPVLAQSVPEAAKPMAAQETPISTPTPAVATEALPKGRTEEIDAELNQLRDRFRDAQATEREGGLPVSREFVQETTARVKALQAEKKSLGEKGAIRLGMLVPPNPVTSVRDWIANNREDVNTIPGKVQDVAERVKYSLGSLSGHMADAIRAMKGQQTWTSFSANRGAFDLHMAQAGEMRKEFDSALKQLIPNGTRRIAVTNYLEAGGDMNILANREAGSKGRFKRGYQVAQHLTNYEIQVADQIRASYDVLALRAQQAGVLHSFLENYVNHIYKQLPPGMSEVFRSAQSGELKSNPSLAMQRVWDTLYTAEQKGAIPQKDVLTLHSTYVDSLERAIASRAFVKTGTQLLATDGRKVFAPSGNFRYIPSSDVDLEGVNFIKAHGKAVGLDDTTGYRQIPHSSMRSYQWAGKDAVGNDVYMQGDLQVHPEHYAEVKAMLESSKVRDYTLGRAALKTAAGIKNSIFLGTGFHPAILSFHGAEFGVNLGKLDKIDVRNNPVHQEAVSHGLQLDDYSAAYVAGKSFEETNPFNSIPGFGRLSQMYQHWVFHDLQPRLKVTAYKVRMEENLKTYGSKLSRDQIAQKTAGEVNNAFGGQDWSKLGISKTVQDLLHIGMIAPDFGLSRTKYIGQSLNPVTHLNQTKAVWARGALGMYAIARVANMVLDDKHDAHWDDPFAVYHNGERHTFRSAQQDLLDAAKAPGRYASARVGPIPQTLNEAYTGRDSQGFERTPGQQLQDFAQRSTQLAVQQYLNSPDSSWWEAMASSTVGMHTQEVRTPAEELATQYRAGNIPRGVTSDIERERFKLLRSIRRMGNRGNMEGVAKAINSGTSSGILAENDADKLSTNLDEEYLPQVIKGLSPPQLLDVYSKASKSEREIIGDTISDEVDKAMDSDNYSEKWKRDLAKRASELLK